MDGPRPCASTRARRAVVLAWTLANLPALCLLLVVVCVRRLCAKDLPDRGIHRGLGCHGRHSHRDRHVGVARAGGETIRDLWFRTLGDRQGNPQGWPPETGRRGDRLAQEPVSTAQWSRAYSLLCADPFRQRRWSRHPVAARLAGQLHRPRYQGRELGSDGGLSRPTRPRPAVRSDQPRIQPLQSAARSPEGRLGGA